MSLGSFDLSWWMLDFVRLRDDSGGITTILCRGSICGRCSFHYQLPQIFSGKGQTVRPQIGTWGVWFLACALQNEIFLSLSFVNIKAQSSESKQSHDTAAKEMSGKCTYALLRKRLDFIWLNLMTFKNMTSYLTNCDKERYPICQGKHNCLAKWNPFLVFPWTMFEMLWWFKAKPVGHNLI